MILNIEQEKLKPGARSPGAKQFGDGWTDRQTDGPTDRRMKSDRGAMLAPKNLEIKNCTHTFLRY
jgi:hypothetical protein